MEKSYGSDQITIELVDQFKRVITDQIGEMSPKEQEIAKDVLRDPVVMRITFITWIDPEAYQVRLRIYNQIPLIEDRDHLVKLFLKEKRSVAKVAIRALTHDLDRCYSVDQQKLRGTKESVSELRKIYSKKVLEKLDQGIIWKDCFPFWSQEKKEDEKAFHYDFHLHFKPRNKQWFENLFDLAAIWSIQDAYLNKEEPDLFGREENQKDILITIYDPEGKTLNYQGEAFSAFTMEKYRPLIKSMAREYAYRREIKQLGKEKEIEDLIFKIFSDLIINYKKGKKSIPEYFKEELNRFFFGEDKIEIIDYEAVQKQDHFIDDFVRRFVENVTLKDEIDETIALNYHQSASEIQQIIEEGFHKRMSRQTILKRKTKMRKTLQNQMKMAKFIADRTRKEIPALTFPEFDGEDFSLA